MSTSLSRGKTLETKGILLYDEILDFKLKYRYFYLWNTRETYDADRFNLNRMSPRIPSPALSKERYSVVGGITSISLGEVKNKSLRKNSSSSAAFLAKKKSYVTNTGRVEKRNLPFGLVPVLL